MWWNNVSQLLTISRISFCKYDYYNNIYVFYLLFLIVEKLVPKNLEASDILQVPQTSTLTRRGSNSSLLSMMSLSGDPHIRICHDCKVLLDRREKQIDDKTAKPVLCQMYDRMHQQMQEIQKLVPVYVQMTSSLR